MRQAILDTVGVLVFAALVAGFVALIGQDSRAETETAAPPPPAVSEECRAWLEWLVDGKAAALLGARISLNGPALHAISETCLGRGPDWTAAQPPMPEWTPLGERGTEPEPVPPPEPETENEPAADRINI